MGRIIRFPVARRARAHAGSAAILRAYADADALSKAEARLLGICAIVAAAVVGFVQFIATH